MDLETKNSEELLKADSFLEINSQTKAIVFCPQCNRILYQIPTNEVYGGVYGRIALNTIVGHSSQIKGHFPEIIFRDKNKNIFNEGMDKAAEIYRRCTDLI